jgi:hypothetical protein
MRSAAVREQAWLGVGTRPKPEPSEKTVVGVEELQFLQLCPIETNRLVGKASCTDYLERFFKQVVCGPQQQYTVVSSPLRARQCFDFAQRHAVVVCFRTPTLAILEYVAKVQGGSAEITL